MLYWRNLRSKLMILYLGLLLLPLLGVGLYGYYYLSKSLAAQAIDYHQDRVQSLSLQMQGSFALLQDDLVYMSELHSTNALTDLSLDDDETSGSARMALRRDILIFASSHPMYRSIVVLDNRGQQVVSAETDLDTGEVLIYDPPSMTAQRINAMLDSAPGSLHMMLSADSDEATSNVIYALRFEEGVVAIELRSAWLFRLMPGSQTAETWSLRLPTGEVLHFAPDNSEVMLPDLSGDDFWQGTPAGYYDDGTDVIFFQHAPAFSLGEDVSWVLFHKIPRNLLYSDLSTYYQTFTLLAVGSFLCVIVLALFAVSRFVEPIRQLKRSVDTMRKTGHTPELPTQLPPDEVGDLTVAFYSMALELEEKRHSEHALIEKLISAQEEERKRIAYDLHDSLIQQLVGARFYLNQCRQELSDSQSGLNGSFSQGYEVLSEAVVEGRRIIEGLHPTIVDDLGLVAAIAELVDTAAEVAGWMVDSTLKPLPQEPDKATSVTLYRIAQEALHNISKHADAHTIRVALSNSDGINLKIADDGVGFDVDSPPESDGGWGIRTMHERTSLLHGKLTISSQPGQGTIVSVWIPTDTALVDGGRSNGILH